MVFGLKVWMRRYGSEHAESAPDAALSRPPRPCIATAGCTSEFSPNAKFSGDKVFREDCDVVIALDGVVFNAADLRRDLHVDSNFEAVKNLYALHGDFFCRSLVGEFCGMLYDKRRRRGIVFTNPTGSKPIYYWRRQDVCAAASRLQDAVSMLRQAGARPSLDTLGAYCLLTFGFMLENTTLVTDVHRLRPGCLLVVDNGRAQEIAYRRFTDPTPFHGTKRDAVEQMDLLFRQAIRRQYSKDLECGYRHFATLSGGLDSRTDVWVARDLGFSPPLAMTFSQSGYSDEIIARKVAADLNMEMHFCPLDNGDYIRSAFASTVAKNGGTVTAAGASHLTHALSTVGGMDRLGTLHTGQLGDAVLGTYVSSADPTPPSISSGAFSDRLLFRIADQVRPVVAAYETEEGFLLYNRGFNGILNGNWMTYSLTECTSPFLDTDFLAFVMGLSRGWRQHEAIYIEWLAAKYPESLRYTWEKTGTRADAAAWRKTVTRLCRQACMVLAGSRAAMSMNPFGFWYRHNPRLRMWSDDYWQEHNARLDPWPELKGDCRRLFDGEPHRGLGRSNPMQWARQRVLGPLPFRLQIMTLIEAIRLHEL